MTQPLNGVGLSIRDLISGGGGPPNGDYTVKESGFANFTYRGKGTIHDHPSAYAPQQLGPIVRATL